MAKSSAAIPLKHVNTVSQSYSCHSNIILDSMPALKDAKSTECEKGINVPLMCPC